MAIEFRTTTRLLPHQEPAVAKMLPIRVGALFMDMGTGKSRTLLEVAAGFSAPSSIRSGWPSAWNGWRRWE